MLIVKYPHRLRCKLDVHVLMVSVWLQQHLLAVLGQVVLIVVLQLGCELLFVLILIMLLMWSLLRRLINTGNVEVRRMFRFTRGDHKDEIRVDIVEKAGKNNLLGRVNFKVSNQIELTAAVTPLCWSFFLCISCIFIPVTGSGLGCRAAEQKLPLLKRIL